MSLSTTKTRDYPKVDRMRGVNYLKTITTTDYTISNEDKGKILLLTNSLSTIVTVAALSIPIGSQIDIIEMSSNPSILTPDTGVTLNSKGAATAISDQYSGVTLIKTGDSEWTLIGDIA